MLIPTSPSFHDDDDFDVEDDNDKREDQGLDDDDATTMDGCLNAAIKQDIIGFIDKPQTNMA